MAETATAKTTTPRKPRARAATAATKAAPAKAAPAAPAEEDKMKIQVNLVSAGETKSYAKFTPPPGAGCVGTLYVPLGTEEVKVLIIGPADAENE